MRITITIDDQILDQLELRAARERTTISALIEDALRMGELRRTQRATSRTGRFHLPTFDLVVPQPGVDLNDNAALLEFMEHDE
ncbi:ribbon-helix-helix domain-containing protein [Saccharopolyspora indica]|uniref:ribbon-helix-helix domain-containing protein n=1 Tax=Saccharopolyspora indica TaxID=1229659 RepID=UPI0022EAD0DD|nr:ribbon-helix-helix domain-containing protein [Saccharopolyspora indica]MDA3646511.1 ribbon-helix-helix domain-containing protein [Saccharopolyspora indica]